MHRYSVPCSHSWKSRGVCGGNDKQFVFIAAGAKGGHPRDQPPDPPIRRGAWLQQPWIPLWGLPPAALFPLMTKASAPIWCRQVGSRIQNLSQGGNLRTASKSLILAFAFAPRVPGVLPKPDWAQIPGKQSWKCRGPDRDLNKGWEDSGYWPVPPPLGSIPETRLKLFLWFQAVCRISAALAGTGARRPQQPLQGLGVGVMINYLIKI